MYCYNTSMKLFTMIHDVGTHVSDKITDRCKKVSCYLGSGRFRGVRGGANAPPLAAGNVFLRK